MKYTVEIYFSPWVNDYGKVERPGYVAEVFAEERRFVHKTSPPSDYETARGDAVKFAEAQGDFKSLEIIDSNP